MEMATTQTLFCRMDYQNGSVWRNEQDEADRSCGKEHKRSVWKTDQPVEKLLAELIRKKMSLTAQSFSK